MSLVVYHPQTLYFGQCPKYCVNEKTGFRYNLLYLDSVFKYKNKLVHNQSPIFVAVLIAMFLLQLAESFQR